LSDGRGRLFVISAPSGAGKTSLVRALMERLAETGNSPAFSVSYTTRQPRPAEQNGVDYHFIDNPAFEQLIADDALLEYAQVFDHYYGTGRDQVAQLRTTGQDVILEIDWQGAAQVRERQPDCTSIFIEPPSLEELERRLRGRAQDSEAVIARRLRDAEADMTHAREFDQVIINDDFDQALTVLEASFRQT